jgi:hypothetical protein
MTAPFALTGGFSGGYGGPNVNFVGEGVVKVPLTYYIWPTGEHTPWWKIDQLLYKFKHQP